MGTIAREGNAVRTKIGVFLLLCVVSSIGGTAFAMVPGQNKYEGHEETSGRVSAVGILRGFARVPGAGDYAHSSNAPAYTTAGVDAEVLEEILQTGVPVAMIQFVYRFMGSFLISLMDSYATPVVSPTVGHASEY